MNVYRWAFAIATLLAGVGCSAFRASAGEDYDRGQAPAPQFAKDSEICATQAEADQKQFGYGGENRPHPCDLQSNVRRLHAGERLPAQAGVMSGLP